MISVARPKSVEVVNDEIKKADNGSLFSVTVYPNTEMSI